MLRKKKKLSHIKSSVKTTKSRRVEDKTKKKVQGQQIENTVTNMVNINPTP